MLYCEECHKLVDDDDVVTESDTYEIWGSPYTKSYVTCPYCGSGNLTDELPPRCSCCDEYCEGHYISTEDDRYYCRFCYTRH